MMGMLSISRKWVVSVTGLNVGFCVEVGFGVFVGRGLACVFFNITVGEAVEIGWAGGVVSSIVCGEHAEMISSRRSMIIKNRFCRFMTSIIAVVKSWSILPSTVSKK
jgi:serine acetyltransferase